VRLELAAAAALLWAGSAMAQDGSDLYRYRGSEQTRWASPESRAARKGAGGIENKGAKGHAWDNIAAGETYVLADVKGAGNIDRLWLTIDDRSPEMLRALKLEAYWDGAKTPAVSVPLGDFFLHGTGEMVPMETALFSSAEGRSFVSYVPMPFRKSARLAIVNDSGKTINIFYDVDYHSVAEQPKDALYFHAWWHRERATKLGQDFRILPRVSGRGRFVGASITVLTNPAYEKSWWGEGEVKVRLDGDGERASLVGTGTEDYIGSAWGQGAYVNRFQGSPVATWDGGGRWSFYRFHIPDPIWFHRDVEVSIAQMGGAPRHDVVRFLHAGVPLIPVTVDAGKRAGGFYPLLQTGQAVTDPALPDAWTNFYRSDDVAGVAYFYLDRPEQVLPPIASGAQRTAALRKPPEKK
jgi:Protein of unknown function (DUF2961)